MVLRLANSVSRFSLVELIAVVVIIGIFGAVGVMGLGSAVDGFVTGRRNVELAQKAQNALQRLILELRFVETDAETGEPLITVSQGGSRVTYTSKRDGSVCVVDRGGALLRLNGQTLTDRVTGFTVVQDVNTGEVRLSLALEQIGTMETAVFP